MYNSGGTKLRNESGEPPEKKRRICSFGDSCYRKNPIHLDEFCHPHLDNLLSSQDDPQNLKLADDFMSKVDRSTVLDQLRVLQGINKRKNGANVAVVGSNAVAGKFDVAPSSQSSSSSSTLSAAHDKQTNFKALKEKCRANLKDVIADGTSSRSDVAARLEAAAPYYYFLTKVRSSPVTHNEPLSITFRELLDPSLGQLEASLQINFMVEMPWLMHHYYFHKLGEKPLLILYGTDNDDLQNAEILPKNIKAIRIKTPHAFGHHHTKMSVFRYSDDSLRVVVSTANLVASDWHNRTQGLWVSPLCPPLPQNADTGAGESPTEFKADLLRYLTFYKRPELQEWLGLIRRTDFSHIRVFFVASVPGTHQGPDLDRWGHRRLGSLLRKHVCGVDSSWPVVGQCSSIGTLGPDPSSWMCGELRASMAQSKDRNVLQNQPAFKMVYPSKKNVFSSLDGPMGGDCLPYSLRTHQKQLWFSAFLYEWKSSKRYRSGAVPHIKSYTRVSPCGSQIAWFHLSSANLSKAAWGMNKKNKACSAGLFMMSYEAGVLFVPQLLVDASAFNLEEAEGSRTPPFSLPYDLPLSRYGDTDEPWVMEYLVSHLKNH